MLGELGESIIVVNDGTYPITLHIISDTDYDVGSFY